MLNEEEIEKKTITNNKFRFSIDRGGTFTDIYAEVPTKEGFTVMKLLSEDPQNYKDAPTEGIKRIMNKVLGLNMKSAKEINIDLIEEIRMGTTVATNALLERKGSKCALITTKGFKDLLKIGNQSRPKIFDLFIEKPSLLYDKVIEIDERICLTEQVYGKNKKFQENEKKLKIGISGEEVFIKKEIDKENVKEICLNLLKEGFHSIAVVLLHSYTYPEHELLIGEIANEVGIGNVSLSHKIMPMIRVVPRGQTTCADAYLTPIIKTYVNNFCNGFSDFNKLLNLVTFMQSDGGLTPAINFIGCRAILSGPAGGVVGYSSTAYNEEDKIPVIGLDMGGTSTDVSRYGGQLEHVYETETAGVQVQAPQIDINTVAAGGGSKLIFNRNGIFQVGPESVGANPGPVCYRKGGSLAVTDANLFLGRLLPEYFPKIFGPSEDEPLDYESTKKAFEELTNQVNEFIKQQKGLDEKLKTPEEVAYGFIEVANEAMSRPIRSMTVAKGFDTREHVLACFGGAGGQHANALLEKLGMKKVFIHRHSGILSAYGLGLADVVHEEQEPCAKEYELNNFEYFASHLENLKKKAIIKLKEAGFKDENITLISYLNMKYKGTDYTIMTNIPKENKRTDNYDTSKELEGNYLEQFEKSYRREYGFNIQGRGVIVDDIRVRGIGKTRTLTKVEIPKAKETIPPHLLTTKTYFNEGWLESKVYNLSDLHAGHQIYGPSVIIHETTTIVVQSNSMAEITKYGDVEIKIINDHVLKEKKNTEELQKVDQVRLSIFNHRFMSIAEQMGKSLQRTSISTNIKERLDFSCALFSPKGDLVCNAPHLPVHLGSMSEAVRFQIKYLGNSWKEGEVILANHPAAGGTHLPDITVITPVYSNGKVVFYVANRGHHADIGSLTPGSMPPFSRYLREEGMAVMSCKIVEDGKFQEERITELLQQAGARSIKDNIADLKAQIAANTKGISLIQDLIQEYSLEVVQKYMQYVQDNAEYAVRQMLQQVFEEKVKSVITNDTDIDRIDLQAEDFMDDGSTIRLKMTLFNQKLKDYSQIAESYKNESDKLPAAIFDFSGTSAMVIGNTNAPKAITVSAILYCLRCLVKSDIPLNQGCLEPIVINIEKHSLLDIGDDSTVGVVGGNVLTSQRVTDVILKAFEAAAASQGCMNNFTFGNETFGYYETICGGSGAGEGRNGQDAVQVHMTNTRITDVEILEKRYPLLLKQFSIRENSGGKGKFKGGNGVIREFEFLEKLRVGILSERRVFAPFGLKGGENALRGENLLITNENGLIHNLSGKNSFEVDVGDRVMIKTPGGGGYGK
ncbi:hypothetical protein ABK040_012649 [Willaertia magna]